MAKNRKTVFKGFSYLQCDDFAAYLSHMAAKGWHFKEFNIGLVFEKGTPENVEYSVEVFTKNSQYDLRPQIHTLDFADYCEAAGWKLIDSRQKFCVFKKVRPDAIPILTPEERLQNASQTQHRQLLGELLLSLLWAVSIVFQFVPKNQFVNIIFSNPILLSSLFLAGFCLYAWGKYIGFWIWKRRAKRNCENGKHDILHNRIESVWAGITAGTTLVFVILYASSVSHWVAVIFLSIILAYLLLGLLLAWIRPDGDTTIGIQILFAIMLSIFVLIGSFSIVSKMNNQQSAPDNYPLHYSMLGKNSGKITLAHDYEKSSILGKHQSYHIFYENASLAYEIYDSKYDWILDIVWDYHRSMTRNDNATDCTDLWNAQVAYQNDLVSYYVRYENMIFILHLHDDSLLNQDQVSVIQQILESGR